MVATTCFPSCLPSSAAIAGMNVARDPSRYARLHLKTPLPASDAANSFIHCQVSFALPRILETIPLFPIGARCPERSGVRSSWLPFSGLRNDTKPFRRCPVLGRMKVACRNCRDVSSAIRVNRDCRTPQDYLSGEYEGPSLTFGRRRRGLEDGGAEDSIFSSQFLSSPGGCSRFHGEEAQYVSGVFSNSLDPVIYGGAQIPTCSLC